MKQTVEGGLIGLTGKERLDEALSAPQPISGQETGEFTPEVERPEVLVAENGTFVDNAFAVPGASGCQLDIGSIHIPIDELVDAVSGFPAAAGTNETVLNYRLSVVSPEVVYP